MFSILDQAAGQAAGDPPAYLNFLMFVPMIAVFYFLMLRPQQRKQKEHQQKIGAMKKGDQVVTAGGLVAKVLRVDETMVDLEIASGVKVRAVKSTIGDILPPGAVPSGTTVAND